MDFLRDVLKIEQLQFTIHHTENGHDKAKIRNHDRKCYSAVAVTFVKKQAGHAVRVSCAACDDEKKLGDQSLWELPLFRIYQKLYKAGKIDPDTEPDEKFCSTLEHYYDLYLREQLAKNRQYDTELERKVYTVMEPRLARLEATVLDGAALKD